MSQDELYETLRENEIANAEIEKMIEVGKFRRAKMSIMEYAKVEGVYLDTAEAENLLARFQQSDLTPEEQTRARFPDRNADLGMRQEESIVDPAHRRIPADES